MASKWAVLYSEEHKRSGIKKTNLNKLVCEFKWRALKTQFAGWTGEDVPKVDVNNVSLTVQ